MLGERDSEAGKFASSLRLSLWSEHPGLHTGELNKIRDPMADSTYKDTWMETAKTYTMIYQDGFSCIPNDLVHTRVALRQCMTYWKEKLPISELHPKSLNHFKMRVIKCTDPMDRLEAIKGHQLFCFPLDYYMCKEDLRPAFNESEYYASQLFY